MAEVFAFSADSQVAETLQREPGNVMTMGGWTFSARPTTPHQRRFRLRLHGMRWLLNGDDTYDRELDQSHNAKLLEEFYERHETWKPFQWNHPHRGLITVRFGAAVNVPAAIPNSGGLIDPLEITLIHHNPSFADDISVAPTSLVPANSTVPSFTGTLLAGSILYGNPGIWNNAPDEYIYSWEADDRAIPGANSANYKLTVNERGKEIRLAVRAKNEAGISKATRSNPGSVPTVTLDNTYANSTTFYANDVAFKDVLKTTEQRIAGMER